MVGNVAPPKLIHTPDPDYDGLAKESGFQGTVVLLIVVDEAGKPQRIRIQRPLGFGLDERAVEAVRKWTFHPATRDGKPVPVQINIEINFVL